MCVCVVCSRSYQARIARAPYCPLWPSPLYSIFPHVINCTIFEKKKKVIEHKMCVLISSANLSETFSFLEGLSEI
jgi:hypothetical protein